jgi:glycosyltransferase involved in cell wall biosynthesis
LSEGFLSTGASLSRSSAEVLRVGTKPKYVPMTTKAGDGSSSPAKKIVVIAGLGWSLVNFRIELIRRMVANGHDVLALAPEFDDETLAQLTALGIRTKRILLDRTGTNPIRDIGTVWSIFRVLRAERPDVVLAYTMKPIVYGGLAARLAGVRQVFALFTGLGYAFMDGHSDAKRRLIRLVTVVLHRLSLRRINGAFCYNEQERRDLRGYRLIPEHVPLIMVPGSGVDTSWFTPTPPVLSPARFLFIGRMLKSKGVGILMEAQRRLRDQGVRAEVHLVGPFDSNPDAVTAQDVRAWEDAGLAVYHGESRDVRPHLAASTVFVLPTFLREGIPRTILEAMASGRAIITTDAPGCGSTIIDGETGFVVPAGRAEPLVTVMRRFVENPQLAVTMGLAARQRACEIYDVRHVNALLLRAMRLEGLSAPSSLSGEALSQTTNAVGR